MNFIQLKNFSVLPNLIHGFTTRELGNDYKKIAECLELTQNKIFYLNQIHSDISFIIDGKQDACVGEGDALITKTPGILIGVKTADCLSLLACDPIKKVVAAIHAGWQGTLKGVIQNTIQKMQAQFSCASQNLYLALGPCLRVQSFEVGIEVIADFRKKYDKLVVIDTSYPKPHLDLAATAKNILESLGCLSQNIFDCNEDTFSQPENFFSFRRGDKTARQFNFVGMRV